jgi:hypothetical protein
MKRLIGTSILVAVLAIGGTASAKDGSKRKVLRKACLTMVAAQNDPVLETRQEKQSAALVAFRKSGNEQTPAVSGPPDAAIGDLCKKAFPNNEKIQEHDFTTWVPLQPDPDGSPPGAT